MVSGPQSTDEYKDIQVPERFDSMLPVLHRELGDTIYAVPQHSTSLAHVVKPAETVPAEATPYQIYDYSLVIENPLRPPAEFQWIGDGVANIRADLTRTDVSRFRSPGSRDGAHMWAADAFRFRPTASASRYFTLPARVLARSRCAGQGGRTGSRRRSSPWRR
ncbi:MAG: hypothetical protein WDO73_14075 [Ignavibacteriota bacterium]